MPKDEVVPARLVWVDAAKGFAISLVVFGHVLGGVLGRGWLRGALGSGVYEYIYLFHMPLFFMISGFFFIQQARLSPINTLKSRIGGIAWPYFLWDFVVRFSMLPLIGGFMAYQPRLPLSDWVERALIGELSWFLWTLFVMQLILIPLAQFPVWILFLTSTSISLVSSNYDLGFVSPVVHYMPYLLFGALLRPVLARLEIPGNGLQLAAALTIFAMIAGVFYLGWSDWAPIKMMCGVAGSLAGIFLVQCCGQFIQARLLAPLGAASLAIYVLHPYFQGLAREVVAHSVGSSPIWQLSLPTIAAIAGPFFIWALVERLHCPWLFRIRLHLPSMALRGAA